MADTLKENKISLDEQGKVEPSRTAALENGMTIKVQSSHEVIVDLNGQEVSVVTAELGATAVIKINWPDKEVAFKATAGRDHHGNPLPLLVSEDRLQLAAGGSIQEISALTGENSADALQWAKLNVGEKDILIVEFSPQNLPLTQVQWVTGEQVSPKEPIPFQTETTKDGSKYQGDKTVTQKDENEEKEIMKLVRSVGDQVQSGTVQGEKILAQPVSQKVTVGTKEHPAAAAISVGDDVRSKLALCKSGGHPGINTGNGFYGMCRFTLPTWLLAGSSSLPNDVGAREQTHRAKILRARSGWGQWLTYTQELGLR